MALLKVKSSTATIGLGVIIIELALLYYSGFFIWLDPDPAILYLFGIPSWQENHSLWLTACAIIVFELISMTIISSDKGFLLGAMATLYPLFYLMIFGIPNIDVVVVGFAVIAPALLIWQFAIERTHRDPIQDILDDPSTENGSLE